MADHDDALVDTLAQALHQRMSEVAGLHADWDQLTSKARTARRAGVRAVLDTLAARPNPDAAAIPERLGSMQNPLPVVRVVPAQRDPFTTGGAE